MKESWFMLPATLIFDMLKASFYKYTCLKHMVDKEGLFVSSEEEFPTEAKLPSGAYKYIYRGNDGTVVFCPESLGVDHVELTNGHFDPLTDTAGALIIAWKLSPEQIEEKVAGFGQFTKRPDFDANTFRAHLEKTYGRTKITIISDYGSDTLRYNPNAEALSKIIQKLSELFPEAVIDAIEFASL